MARSGTPAYLSWILAILLHADVIVILAVVFAEDAVEEAPPDEPDFHLTQLAPKQMVPVELRRDDKFGGWPLRCDHRQRTLDISEDRLGDGLRCDACGWPWWVIRARSQQ